MKILVLMVFMVTLSVGCFCHAEVLFEDEFTGGEIDSATWIVGGGGEVKLADGQVLMRFTGGEALTLKSRNLYLYKTLITRVKLGDPSRGLGHFFGLTGIPGFGIMIRRDLSTNTFVFNIYKAETQTANVDLGKADAEFHEWQIEWTVDYVKVFMDGKEKHNYTDKEGIPAISLPIYFANFDLAPYYIDYVKILGSDSVNLDSRAGGIPAHGDCVLSGAPIEAEFNITAGKGLASGDLVLHYDYYTDSPDGEDGYVSLAITGGAPEYRAKGAIPAAEGDKNKNVNYWVEGRTKRSVTSSLSPTLIGKDNAGTIRLTQAIVMGNEKVRFLISRDNGGILEGWNVETGERYFTKCNERYFLENEKETVKVDDTKDVVIAFKDTSAGDKKQHVFSCENSVLKEKGISVEKIYTLNADENKLTQQIVLTNEGQEGYFFRWYTKTTLDPDFRNGKKNDSRKGPIYYYVPWGPPFNLTHKIDRDTLVHAYYPNFQFHMSSVVNTKEGYGAANYLYRVNEKFSQYVSSSDEYGDNLLHTPDGWDYCVYIDYLNPQTKSSATLCHTIFKGDSTAFLKEYMELHEVQELRKGYPVADWVKDVKLFTFAYKATDIVMNDKVIETYNQYLEKFGEGVIMVLYEYCGGDIFSYFTDDADVPWMQERVKAFHEKSPRTKIGVYINPAEITNNTPAAREHPEWFFVNRDGKKWQCSFPDQRAREVANAASREYFVRKVYEAVKFFDFDYMYHDGGTGFPVGAQLHRSDWGNKVVPQWYDTYLQVTQFSEAIKRNGRNKAVYFNSPNPFSGDFGFQETPSGTWSVSDWRMLSEIMYSVQFCRNGDIWNAIIYWHMDDPKPERRYLNYLFALGFRPSTNPDHDRESERMKIWDMRIPYINAAYEIKDSFLINAGVSPWWRRDETEEVDAFALKQFHTGLISLINYGQPAENVPVSADTVKMGFSPDKPVFIWTHELVDRDKLAPDTKFAFNIQDFTIMEEPGERIAEKVFLEKELVKILSVSQSPGFVYSIEGRPSHMRLSDTRGVKTSGEFDSTRKRVKVNIESERRVCQIMVPFSSTWGRPEPTMDGRQVKFDEHQECGHRFLLIEVPDGSHTIEVGPVGK